MIRRRRQFLTFCVYSGEPDLIVREFTAEDVYMLLRARVLMFERCGLAKDFELERLLALSYRIIARLQEKVVSMFSVTENALDRIVRDRWEVREIGPWKRSGTFYQTECIARDGSPSTVHIHPIEG